MKKIFSLSLILTLIGFSLTANVFDFDKIDKQTYTYSIKGNDTLRFDKYDVPSITGNKPCVIFVFGGGFAEGKRDAEYNKSYMQKLAESGYVAIAIDYRLGMKQANNQKIDNPMDIVNMLENAINIAVEDLFDATNFVLEHASEWNIDKGKIVANGSSAGAITVLHGEYSICNKGALSERLPDNFNYAGIIAFAGAIYSNNGNLKWASKPAPIQMFHGDADSNVPYNNLKMFSLGIYGSKYIAEQMSEMQTPHYFYSVENAAHEVASLPMKDNLEEINSFITRFVVNNKDLIMNVQMKEIGKPEMKKDFEVMDFIKSNYGNI